MAISVGFNASQLEEGENIPPGVDLDSYVKVGHLLPCCSLLREAPDRRWIGMVLWPALLARMLTRQVAPGRCGTMCSACGVLT